MLPTLGPFSFQATDCHAHKLVAHSAVPKYRSGDVPKPRTTQTLGRSTVTGGDDWIPSCNKHGKPIPEGAVGTWKRGLSQGFREGFQEEVISERCLENWAGVGGWRKESGVGLRPLRVWLVERRAPNAHSLTVSLYQALLGPQTIEVGGWWMDTWTDLWVTSYLREHFRTISWWA